MIADVDKPCVTLDQDDLEGLKDYDVGDVYYALYKCKMLSKSVDDDGQWHGTFEVLNIKAVPHEQIDKVKQTIGVKDYLRKTNAVS